MDGRAAAAARDEMTENRWFIPSVCRRYLKNSTGRVYYGEIYDECWSWTAYKIESNRRRHMVTHFSLNPIRKPFTAWVDTRTSNMYELCPTTFRIAHYAHTHRVRRTISQYVAFESPNPDHVNIDISLESYFQMTHTVRPLCQHFSTFIFDSAHMYRYRASDRTMHSTYSQFSLVTNCSFTSITFTVSHQNVHHSLQIEVIQDTLARALQSQTSSFQCVSLSLENVSNHIWPVHFAFVKCVCEAMKQYQEDGWVWTMNASILYDRAEGTSAADDRNNCVRKLIMNATARNMVPFDVADVAETFEWRIEMH